MKTNNHYPRIGIISGAGPMAGALLFGKIIQIAQEKYGCQKDADFPYTMMISYPFAEMLHNVSPADCQIVKEQLKESLAELAQNKIKIATIACNTLHAFLDEETIKGLEVLHLIKETANTLKQLQIDEAFVICTITSASCRLHQQYFSCTYMDYHQQIKTQELIDKIMAGKHRAEDVKNLSEQLNAQLEQFSKEKIGLVLGCTEFSVLNDQFPMHAYGLDPRFIILDPSSIIAEKICQLTVGESKLQK